MIVRHTILYSFELEELMQASRKELRKAKSLDRNHEANRAQQASRTPVGFHTYTDNKTAFLLTCIMLFGIGETYFIYLLTS